MRDLIDFHNEFYKIKAKVNQDNFLVNCISTFPIKRRRTKDSSREPRTLQLKFHVRRSNDGIYLPVCKQAFLKILNVTRARVDYVAKQFVSKGAMPTEKRGGDRKSSFFEGKKKSITEFVKSLNCIESHYCRGKSERKYLSSDLSINKLCKMYNNKPGLSEDLKVKPSYFRYIFNRKFNLGFKSPKTDACSTCIVIDEKLKNEKDPQKKSLLMINKRVHKLRAKSFYNRLKDNDPELLILSFDMQKNLCLPKVPDQQAYYSRQLYLYNFTIVQGHSKSNLNKTTCTSYCWTEDEFSKGSNQISSAVYQKLNSIDMTPYNRVRLMADACGGQNKNQALLCMCSKWFLDAPDSIKSVEVIFPVRGHSFLPSDRVFGKIELDIRKQEVISNPEEYLEIIDQRATIQKLDTDCVVFDWLSEAKRVFKATSSWHFKMSLSKRFIFKRSTKNNNNILIKGEENYNSSINVFKTICKKDYETRDINPTQIPKGNLTNIKPAKISDVKKLLNTHYGNEWITMDKLKYFKEIIENYKPCGNSEREEDILCEPQHELEEFELNLVSV